MASGSRVLIKKPSECSEKEMNDFLEMMELYKKESGINHGFRDIMMRAKYLAFQYVDGRLAGILAIKVPHEGHRKRVFREAGVPGLEKRFPYERGWGYLLKEYRGRGLHRVLSRKLAGKTRYMNVFVTTKKTNIPVVRVLEDAGFRRVGKPFRSRIGDYDLVLFVREASGK